MPAVPATPENLTILEQTTDSFRVSWDHAGQADNFTLIVENADDFVVIDIDYTMREATVSNLPMAGKRYAVRLTASIDYYTSQPLMGSVSTGRCNTAQYQRVECLIG